MAWRILQFHDNFELLGPLKFSAGATLGLVLGPHVATGWAALSLLLVGISGYSALFRHADGELNYCVYLIPGNPKINMDKDLSYWHNYLMNEDENIKKAFLRTDNVERMKAGELHTPYL